jgi:ribosomal protein S18 acetylase RimI-like enzyme
MSAKRKQGLVRTTQLTEATLAEIRQLAAICNEYEHIQMFLPTRWLLRETVGHFFYYEGGILVGYIAFDSASKELVGMVHPAYRRRGIFRKLLHALYHECKRRSIDFVVFICERASSSGQAFIQAMSEALTLVLSEHQMVLKTYRPRKIVGERIRLRLVAEQEDVEAAVSVAPEDAEEVRRHVTHALQSTGERAYLGILDNNQPIGMLRLIDMDNHIGIYTLIVHPDYRGRGYGRQMLQEAIRIAQAEGAREIMLEVNIYNENALGLYLSVGFEFRTTYEYYYLPISVETDLSS